jgi:hypothetical protein
VQKKQLQISSWAGIQKCKCATQQALNSGKVADNIIKRLKLVLKANFLKTQLKTDKDV